MKLSFTLNHKKKIFEIPPNRTLLDLLRSQGLWSVKHGCETGGCGNCTVVVDGKAIYSCLMLAAQAEGKRVETFESIRELKEYGFLKEVFMHYGDIECGYCVSGLMMSTKALLDSIVEPTEEEIVEALAGNVCRCTKKPLPIPYIMEATKKMRGKW